MDNFILKLKKALTNKNFVTAIAFLLIGVVLIVGYNMRIDAATAPIKVPFANQTIPPQTKITSDMIGTMSIASDAVDKDVIFTEINDIKNLYTNIESTIYQGSFFYKGALVAKESLPSSALLDVPEGQTLLHLSVNMTTSYFNSLIPGDYFDLYVRTIGVLPGDKKKENDILVGKLFDNIRILAVKTANGENVFGGTETKIPAAVLFALPEDLALLTMKAQYFDKLNGVSNIEFVIVPRGTKPKSDDGTELVPNMTSDELEEYIKDKTKDIDIKEIKKNNNPDEEK